MLSHFALPVERLHLQWFLQVCVFFFLLFSIELAKQLFHGHTFTTHLYTVVHLAHLVGGTDDGTAWLQNNQLARQQALPAGSCWVFSQKQMRKRNFNAKTPKIEQKQLADLLASNPTHTTYKGELKMRKTNEAQGEETRVGARARLVFWSGITMGITIDIQRVQVYGNTHRPIQSLCLW